MAPQTLTSLLEHAGNNPDMVSALDVMKVMIPDATCLVTTHGRCKSEICFTCYLSCAIKLL